MSRYVIAARGAFGWVIHGRTDDVQVARWWSRQFMRVVIDTRPSEPVEVVR